MTPISAVLSALHAFAAMVLEVTLTLWKDMASRCWQSAARRPGFIMEFEKESVKLHAPVLPKKEWLRLRLRVVVFSCPASRDRKV